MRRAARARGAPNRWNCASASGAPRPLAAAWPRGAGHAGARRARVPRGCEKILSGNTPLRSCDGHATRSRAIAVRPPRARRRRRCCRPRAGDLALPSRRPGIPRALRAVDVRTAEETYPSRRWAHRALSRRLAPRRNRCDCSSGDAAVAPCRLSRSAEHACALRLCYVDPCPLATSALFLVTAAFIIIAVGGAGRLQSPSTWTLLSSITSSRYRFDSTAVHQGILVDLDR